MGGHEAGGKCRVLIVEDHADTRKLMVRLLQERYEVLFAESYDTALSVADDNPPHVVISDVNLPGRSGFELMTELRARCGSTGIAVTGHATDDTERYRECGFAHVLRKPIVVEQLIATLNACCTTPAE